MSGRGVRLCAMNRLDNAAFPAPVVEGFKRILRLWAVWKTRGVAAAVEAQ